MNVDPNSPRKQANPAAAPVRPVVQPAIACERVMLEAQRIALEVARSRAAS